MKGAQACLKSSMIALLCRSDLAMENLVTKLENLNAVSVIICFGGRGKVAPLNCQGEDGCGRHSVEPSQSQSNNQNSLIHEDLVDSGVTRSDGEGNGNHSSTFAWKVPWTEEPGGLQSMGS